MCTIVGISFIFGQIRILNMSNLTGLEHLHCLPHRLLLSLSFLLFVDFSLRFIAPSRRKKKKLHRAYKNGDLIDI